MQKYACELVYWFSIQGVALLHLKQRVTHSAVVDTTFVDIYVDTKNIPTCRYNIQHID